MNCKNCKKRHKIYKLNNGEYVHLDGTICKCGCKNPEPQH